MSIHLAASLQMHYGPSLFESVIIQVKKWKLLLKLMLWGMNVVECIIVRSIVRAVWPIPVFLEALCLNSGEVCDSVWRGEGRKQKRCPLLL